MPEKQEEPSENRSKYFLFFSCYHYDSCANFKCKRNNELPLFQDPYITSNGCKCGYKNEIASDPLINTTFEVIGVKDLKNNISLAYQKMREKGKHCLFVINLNKPITKLNYFQLGYAMGKGIKTVGLWDEYLFSWDKIPGDDNKRLIEFLKQYFDINCSKTVKIEKTDSGRTIQVSTNMKSLSLSLDGTKTKVILKADDEKDFYAFDAKTENGNLYVYNDGNYLSLKEEDKCLQNLINIITCNSNKEKNFLNCMNDVFEGIETMKPVFDDNKKETVKNLLNCNSLGDMNIDPCN